MLKMCFERSGRGQEPSRGHKFSILENVVLHWDFTSAVRLHFRSDLVGVALVGATPLHLLSQTALPLKSPTGAFIAPLDPIAKLGHFYAVIQCDIVHIKASLLR